MPSPRGDSPSDKHETGAEYPIPNSHSGSSTGAKAPKKARLANGGVADEQPDTRSQAMEFYKDGKVDGVKAGRRKQVQKVKAEAMVERHMDMDNRLNEMKALHLAHSKTVELGGGVNTISPSNYAASAHEDIAAVVSEQLEDVKKARESMQQLETEMARLGGSMREHQASMREHHAQMLAEHEAGESVSAS